MTDLDRLIASLVAQNWTPAQITSLLSHPDIPQGEVTVLLARHTALNEITRDITAAFDRVLRVLEALRVD